MWMPVMVSIFYLTAHALDYISSLVEELVISSI